MVFPTTLEELLIAGYVLFCMGLNAISFLIAAFYQKKTGSHTPFLGFLLSLLLGTIFIATFFMTDNSYSIDILRTTSLLGCSMSSTLSMIGLFMSMRRRRAK